MKKLMTTLAIVVAIVIIAGVALRLAIPSLTGESVASGIEFTGDGGALLGDCPDTPNCQSSEASRDNQKVGRFNMTRAASEAITTIDGLVSDLPGAAVVAKNKRYLHATFKSRIMGFTDDVEFLVSDDDSSVQIRSASRLGKSDLGANAKRVAMLRTLFDGKI